MNENSFVFGILAIILLCGTLIIMVGILTKASANVGISGHCRITGIQYVDTKGAPCPTGLSNKLCPLPANVECNIKGQAQNILALKGLED